MVALGGCAEWSGCGEKGELERMERLLLGRHRGKELCGVGISAGSMSVVLPGFGVVWAVMVRSPREVPEVVLGFLRGERRLQGFARWRTG